jgi:hypothetical protein
VEFVRIWVVLAAQRFQVADGLRAQFKILVRGDVLFRFFLLFGFGFRRLLRDLLRFLFGFLFGFQTPLQLAASNNKSFISSTYA